MKSPESSISRRFVEQLWTLEAGPEDTETVRKLLLDHVGVTAWGSQLTAGKLMQRHAVKNLQQSGKRMPMIGTGVQTSPLGAAMANSVAAAAFEFDDTHTGASVHPGAVIFPAAMAAAAIGGCSDRTFLRAIVVGYEAMCRVGRAANGPSHRARHFHPTSTAGHFGAAAAAAIAFGLDSDAALAAIGLAGTAAGGSMQFLVEGAWTKQIHPAFAVQRGVQAAQLATLGFPGLEDPIAGERGFLVGQSEDPQPEKLLDGFGRARLEIHNTGIKPYPSCRNTQSPLDALFSVIGHEDLRAGDVEKVTFGVIGPGIQTIFEPVEVKRRPRTVVEAQFSMPFVAAIALLDREVTARQFAAETFADPDVLSIADRIECVHDPALDRRYPDEWPAWVEVRTRDGRVLTGSADSPSGDPDNRLTDSQLRSKFRGLMSRTYSEEETSRIEETVGRAGEVNAYTDLLGAL